LDIDLSTDNPTLVKRYYDREILHFFKKVKGMIARKGFIGETMVWVPSDEKDRLYDVYELFSLKVQLRTVSNYPELLVSYNGKKRVNKKTVSEMILDVPPKNFHWILQNNSLFKYDKMAEFEEPGYDTAYPVMNNRLRKAMNLPTEAPVKGNRYLKYWARIKDFYLTYLDIAEFKALIPLHDTGFIKVSPATISRTRNSSNDLSFGNNQKGRIPKYDVRNLKPFQKSPFAKIHLFFIVHKDDIEVAKTLNKYFEKGLDWFGGLYDFASLLFHTEKHFSVIFGNKDNPLPEIESKLDGRNFDPGVKYIAVYVTPYGKYVEEEGKRKVYYRVKEMLLKRNITSQVIEANKVIGQGGKYVYSLLNIAVAMLAKLDGIPWRIHTPKKNELIVGIGAFKHKEHDVQYIGSAFSFDNLGGFNSFDCFMRHETNILAGCIAAKVKEYATVNSSPDRLIIHFFKKLSRAELAPIEKALKELELPKPIPIYIITINKTEADDTVAFDFAYQELMAESGTYINIGENKYLLYNNTRYDGTIVSSADGFPFPVKLAIDCTDKTKLKDLNIINELIDQVYQFSRMYWKSVRQQNLPVTIKYPEMVAQIAPYFEDNDIPQYGKNNLWFL
jgi:hypothetical protein